MANRFSDTNLDRCERSEIFAQVMLPHLDAAYGLARYLAKDSVAAEDIAQDAFLRAFRSFDQWRGDSAKAWILTIVRNCFLSYVSAQRSAVSTCDWTSDLPSELIGSEHPDSLLLEKSEAAKLHAVIHTLPVPFREALILRELEELSYKEIADMTQVPIGTVMSRLSRARQMLAERLLPPPAQDEDRDEVRLKAC
jgi:RNA polymerase sigma factor (sigma-70 family)